MTKEITIGELEATIKWFKKDKRPSRTVGRSSSIYIFLKPWGWMFLKLLNTPELVARFLNPSPPLSSPSFQNLTTLPTLMTRDLYIYVTASIRSWKRLLQTRCNPFYPSTFRQRNFPFYKIDKFIKQWELLRRYDTLCTPRKSKV